MNDVHDLEKSSEALDDRTFIALCGGNGTKYRRACYLMECRRMRRRELESEAADFNGWSDAKMLDFKQIRPAWTGRGLCSDGIRSIVSPPIRQIVSLVPSTWPSGYTTSDYRETPRELYSVAHKDGVSHSHPSYTAGLEMSQVSTSDR